MSFSADNGYSAYSFNQLMDYVRAGVNAQFGTTYDATNFIGTNFYKFYYGLIQRLQENEVKTAEIFLKLQDYFKVTNELISQPIVTAPGLIAEFARTDYNNGIGWEASVKPPILADAGKLYVAVNVDETATDYPAKKLEINTILKDSTAAGVITQGTEVNTIVLSNGQSFDFKFALPHRLYPWLRLTIKTSENNQVYIPSPDDIKQKLIDNIDKYYGLGLNFEPQKYYSVCDAPWAESAKLEYSLDNKVTWTTDTYDAAYNDLFVIDLAKIELVET